MLDSQGIHCIPGSPIKTYGAIWCLGKQSSAHLVARPRLVKVGSVGDAGIVRAAVSVGEREELQ